MIEVKLRTNWFGPDGALYKSSRNPHLLPEDFKKSLPKSAVVSEVSDSEDDETPKGKK